MASLKYLLSVIFTTLNDEELDYLISTSFNEHSKHVNIYHLHDIPKMHKCFLSASYTVEYNTTVFLILPYFQSEQDHKTLQWRRTAIASEGPTQGPYSATVLGEAPNLTLRVAGQVL